jgi:hypothetical protein
MNTEFHKNLTKILLLTPSDTKTDRRKTSGRGLIVRRNFFTSYDLGAVNKILTNLRSFYLPWYLLSNRPLGPVYKHEFVPVTLRENVIANRKYGFKKSEWKEYEKNE